MELTSVVQLIYQATKRLDKIQRQIFKLAEQKAVTENAYRQKLAEEMMKLRAENIPTTLIPDMARGNTSYFKLERDLAEGTYKSALSAMEALKVEINALQSVAKYQNEVGS